MITFSQPNVLIFYLRKLGIKEYLSKKEDALLSYGKSDKNIIVVLKVALYLAKNSIIRNFALSSKTARRQ